MYFIYSSLEKGLLLNTEKVQLKMQLIILEKLKVSLVFTTMTLYTATATNNLSNV